MVQLEIKDLKYSLAEREAYLQNLQREIGGPHVLLQTCNRVELYRGENPADQTVTEHLFRVVSGLESAFLGETAIQGQVKQAYLNAKNLSPELHKLFQNALRVGKRVRTETKISQGALSHSQAVLEVIKSENLDLTNAKVLIIGINKLSLSIIKYFQGQGAKIVFLANRTYEKALKYGQELGCQVLRLDHLQEKLQEMDILISATSAPHLIIKKNDLRPTKNIYLFDLAVPRDIDPELGTVPGVTLFNIEEIESRIKQNQSSRAAEVKHAARIIAEEVRGYYAKA